MVPNFGFHPTPLLLVNKKKVLCILLVLKKITPPLGGGAGKVVREVAEVAVDGED